MTNICNSCLRPVRYAPSYQAFGADGKNQLTTGPTAPYTYDSNGNLTGYNTYFYYEYDAENRLSAWEYSGTARTEMRYDGLGRLREVTEYGPGGAQWTWQSQKVYIYDGMRVIQERSVYNWDYANATPTVSYTRGTDLSGSLEGAGGIGGLLARSHGYSSGNWSTHNFYHADGNGNITYLVNSSQTVAASYRYDPYGNTISQSGSLADANVYRFSSKESVQFGMYPAIARFCFYYYGYRFYDPNLQRWPNRDPLGEPGFELLRHQRSSVRGSGTNPYLFVKNSPINGVDYFGLMDSITLGFLGCVRSGNSPGFCACVLAPDPEECEKKYGACIDAIGKIPNPKTGKIEKPNPADICKCACSMMYQDEKDKNKRDDCEKACEKKFPCK